MEKKISKIIDRSGRNIYLTEDGVEHLKRHPGILQQLDRIEETLEKK